MGRLMTNLLKELEAAMRWGFHGNARDFLRTHHAEIAEAVKDARRYRWLKKNDNAYLLAEDVIDAAIDAHNSAREVGE